MSKLQSAARSVRSRGLQWTVLVSLYRGLAGRRIGGGLARGLRHRLIELERRRFMVGPGTLSSWDHTVEENRSIWDGWDWSRDGNEWTDDVRAFRGQDPEVWKAALLTAAMLPYAERGGTLVEIGPGAGRWTEHLQALAGRLVLFDIAPRCLELCRERFRGAPNIEYVLTDGRSLPGLEDATVDFIWSYDVFVHVNPTDAERYLAEFARVLKPGGYASIHHAGTYQNEQAARRRFRSFLDAAFIAHLSGIHGLEVVRQDDTLAHYPGDVVSVLRKE